MGLASTRLRPYTALTRRCITAREPLALTGVTSKGTVGSFASKKFLHKGAFPRPDSPLRALSRSPGAVASCLF